MKATVDVKNIAKELRAERRGTVAAAGGYVGASQIAADVQARSRQNEEGRRPAAPPSRRPSDDGEG
jgi:hypothetical protein